MKASHNLDHSSDAPRSSGPTAAGMSLVEASTLGLVDSLVDAISVDDHASIERFHRLAAAPQPCFWWLPHDEVLPGGLQRLMDYWSGLRGGAPIPRRDQIDPLSMREMLGFIMLIDVIDRGVDFRYRLYGSKIADLTGVDLTGRLLSQAPIEPSLAMFVMAGYRAVTRRAAAYFSSIETISEGRAILWSRLALPLSDREGAVSRILVGCAPTETTR